MSVRFLVYFFCTSILFLNACTGVLQYPANKSTEAENRANVVGTGVLDEYFLGKYKITVSDPNLFAKTVFKNAKCKEYKMQIIKDKFALYKDSYLLSLACLSAFNSMDVSPFLYVWQEYIRHGYVIKKNYFERRSIESWYDIGSDFIFYTFQSIGSAADGGTQVSYSARTLINFSGADVTITISEKSADKKSAEINSVVARGYKVTE